MKKKSILLFAFFLGVKLAIAQNISFTIKPGSDANSVAAFIKSNANLNGVVSQILVTFTIPSSVSPTPPAATFATNSSFPQWGALSLNPPTTEVVDGISSYVYTFFGAPVTSTTTAFTNGTEVLLGEISFAPGTDFSGLKLVSLPGGGLSTISFLAIELGGIIITNTSALTYGGDASNSASGYDGLSSVSLISILPVKFLSFYALKNGDDAKLSWTVANDVDNKYFDLQRSVNGRDFASFAQVNAHENGNSTNTYQATDGVISKNGSKDLYYRIKQVDKNGSTAFSPVRKLEVGFGKPVILYPNPARSISKLVVEAPEAGKASIIIRDATGRQVQQLNLQFIKGINQKDINVSALPVGDYKVSVIAKGLNQTLKLSKFN